MWARQAVAKEMEPFRLVWLEEPVPPDNFDAMADIRQSSHTPICCGENVYMRWGFRPLFERHAVDIIMPDIQKCGGLMEGKKIGTWPTPTSSRSRRTRRRRGGGHGNGACNVYGAEFPGD